MARGRRNLTLGERYKKVTEEIRATKEALKELEIEKKELEEQLRIKRLEELDNLITAKGLSIDAVKTMLDK